MNQNNNESNFMRWYRTDAHEGLGWALIFLMAATLLAIEISGVTSGIGWWDGWAVFFLGLGIIVLLGAVVRRIVIGRRVEGFGAVCGTVMVAIGVDGLLGVEWIWPIVLGAIGALILFSVFAQPSYEDDVEEWDWKV
jgi:hypothetical protein